VGLTWKEKKQYLSNQLLRVCAFACGTYVRDDICTTATLKVLLQINSLSEQVQPLDFE